MNCAVLVVVVSLLVPGDSLDASFAKWLGGPGEIRYGEIATRFLQAAGRDVSAYTHEMDALARDFRAFLEAHQNPEPPRERVVLLRRFLFEERGFRADLDLTELGNLYPDAILRRKRGYCLGLSVVILDLAERVGWPLIAVSAPRHTFLRYPSSPHLNLETTLEGEIHDDEWYRKRFDLGAADRNLLRPLSPRQTAAHILNNHGFVLLERGQLEGAARDIREALRTDPGLVEARINLGVYQARSGDLKGALQAFEAVEAKWPGDPYCRLNRANALISLDRPAEAAELGLGLLETHPQLTGLSEVLQTIRERLDPRSDWSSLQRLSIALNGRRSKRSPGLRGTYFRDARLREVQLTRIDRDISFTWSWKSPGRGIPSDQFSVRWTGLLKIPHRDLYTFYVICSDGVRIWVDGRRVVDAWRRANNNFTEGAVDLLPGLHDLRIEFFESVGEAGIKLMLTSKSQEDFLPLEEILFHVP
jgi:regulator of sirC expression with transglutaminase-like and TPR domain